MNRFKSISVVLFAAVLAGVVISCKEEEKTDLKAEGKKAGTEMCGCVASYDEPNFPMSPLPPAGLDLQELFGLDLQDPAVFAGLDPEVQAYLTDPAIQQYLSEFKAYAMQLSQCVNVAPYQQYIDFVYANYDPTAAEPLYSVFDFKNSDFEQGFKEGTNGCKEAFEALFALMGGQ